MLFSAIRKFGIKPRGVIHIGAHIGTEHKLYTEIFKKMIYIEADPDTFKKLISHVRPNGTSVIAENFAISNQDGTAEFFKTNNQQSSSLLKLDTHKILHPQVKETGTITVPTRQLDTYFQSSSASIADYNVIAIDIQGAELMAFKGGTETLKNIDCILAEINYAELYKGCGRIWELDELLFKSNFVRADTMSYNNGWGDAVYINRKFLLPSTSHAH